MSAILTQITQAKELFQESDCDGRSMALLGWPCLQQVKFFSWKISPWFSQFKAKHPSLWPEGPRCTGKLVDRRRPGRAEDNGLSCNLWRRPCLWPLPNCEQTLQRPGVHQVIIVLTLGSVDYLLRMLRDEVLPEIQAVLGPRRWQRCIFQQVWLLNLFFTRP